MATDSRPNIVLITADDMNWDAVGAFGCPVPGTTPNIDRLAHEGIRFTHGHVTIAVCQPSRSAMMTGLYPHNSGGEGFFRLRKEGLPILPDLLRNSGYDVGILGKVPHSTPYEHFKWDMGHDIKELGTGRNPGVYRGYAEQFVAGAQERRRPFFLMYNSHDPHRPFYGNDPAEWYEERDPPAAIPSRVFTPEEITVPGFLEELPEVRLEISEYYSSVRRCDDSVGGLLNALDEAGVADNTLLLFLSDNGMAFPYAKTNCYLNSTQTPWIMRWPDVIREGATVTPGAADESHFVSGIDITPTFLEAAGVAYPVAAHTDRTDPDGRSFLHLLRGEPDDTRSTAVTQFHQTALRRNYPMRCIQSARFGYIFNPWSDGKRVFQNESQSGRTFNAMKVAAENDGAIRHRVEFFLHRVVEEFYDFRVDPNARRNLIDDPSYQDEIEKLCSELEENMRTYGDPLLEVFCHRNDKEWRERGMTEVAELIGGE